MSVVSFPEERCLILRTTNLMKKHVTYTLFTRPISRRMFYWLLVLCPVAAVVLYLLSRCETELTNSADTNSFAA